MNADSSHFSRALAIHLARVALCFAGLVVAHCASSATGAALVAGMTFFAAFALTHDLAHGALRLPRVANEIALSLAALPLLLTGHGLRVMHLRHHARPLADDDLEGAGARLSLLGALWIGPRTALAIRAEGLRAARGKARTWQVVEGLANAATLVTLLASSVPTLQIYALVALSLQATMSVWASHVAHHAPDWLTRAAASLAWTGSPVVLSLAYHERHHAHPKVPCQDLARL